MEKRLVANAVIALLQEQREAHLEKALEFERAILDLGGDVPEEPVVTAPTLTRKVKRKQKGKRANRLPRRDHVLHVASGLEQPVDRATLCRLVYSGKSARERRNWYAAVAHCADAALLRQDTHGMIIGAAR